MCFIVVQTREVVDEPGRGTRQAVYSPVFNAVEGIGLDNINLNGGPGTFTNDKAFNTFSDARLQGIIFDNRIDGAPLSHEVMHRWAAHAGESLGWLDGADHYVANSDINGMMDLDLLDGSGFAVALPGAPFLPTDLVSNGNGTYRLASRPGEFNTTFAPVSLYFAGFLAASQVPTMNILQGSVNLTNPNIITATNVQPITVNNVIGVEGPRVPSSVAALRAFTVGAIIIGNRPYSEAEYTFLTLMLRYWESNKTYDGTGAPPWRAATLGASTLTVALPTLTTQEPEPAPEPPAPGEGRNVALSSGWNLVGYTGTVNVAEATASIAGAFASVFDWNAMTQSFRSFNPTLPAVLNSLKQLIKGSGVWLFVTSGTGATWQQTAITEARSVPLQPGFNLVMWSGPNGTPVADAVASLGGTRKRCSPGTPGRRPTSRITLRCPRSSTPHRRCGTVKNYGCAFRKR